MPIDLAELQGNVLCGYGHPRAAYRFCRVDDAAVGRAWLAALAPQVTSAVPWTTRPERTLNVALSCAGLRALGVPEAVLAQLPGAFRAGMAARAARLGDGGADAPAHWEAGLDDQLAHVLLTVYADGPDEDALDRALAAVPVPAGVSVLATERAALLPGGREHFGFADGLAQPAVDDPVAGPYDGQGTPHRRNRRTPPVDRWPPVAPGEFVFGYPDEDGDIPGGPAPLDRNATFMVVRKLAQDVGMWERQLRRWSGGDPDLAVELAARQVGRWPNGTPVARHPDAPDPALDAPGADSAAARRERFQRLNDFRYGDDRPGARCPAGAHVRRANPRDALGDGRLAARHRLIRRGMPYGPEATDRERHEAADGPDRGLMFVCFQASIERQFELVQGDWLADGDAFGLGAHRDVFSVQEGTSGRLVVRAGDAATVLDGHGRCVTLRGGGYFLVPSIPALAALPG